MLACFTHALPDEFNLTIVCRRRRAMTQLHAAAELRRVSALEVTVMSAAEQDVLQIMSYTTYHTRGNTQWLQNKILSQGHCWWYVITLWILLQANPAAHIYNNQAIKNFSELSRYYQMTTVSLEVCTKFNVKKNMKQLKDSLKNKPKKRHLVSVQNNSRK